MRRTHGLQSSVDFSLLHRKRKAQGSPIRHSGLSSRTSSKDSNKGAVISSVSENELCNVGLDILTWNAQVKLG
jgi:hypothetical protein